MNPKVMLRFSMLMALTMFAVGCADTTPTGPSTLDLTPGRLSIEAFPQTVLLSGSEVRITARVQAADGTNATGARVQFTTSAGTITPSDATVDFAGFAIATLSAAEAATVTVTADGVSASREIRTTAPFAIRLAGAPTGFVGGDWRATVSIEPNTAVVNPPTPSRIRFQCGNAEPTEQPFTGSSLSPVCRFAEVGTHSVTATAIAPNGWTTAAVSTVAISTAPAAPAPPPTPAPQPAISVSATEVHRTGSSALWRVTVSPANGVLEGDIAWDFDYIVADPTAPGAQREIRQTNASVTEQDVIYLSEGTRQIRVRATVGSQNVTGTATIAVEFP